MLSGCPKHDVIEVGTWCRPPVRNQGTLLAMVAPRFLLWHQNSPQQPVSSSFVVSRSVAGTFSWYRVAAWRSLASGLCSPRLQSMAPALPNQCQKGVDQGIGARETWIHLAERVEIRSCLHGALRGWTDDGEGDGTGRRLMPSWRAMVANGTPCVRSACTSSSVATHPACRDRCPIPAI